MKKTYDTYHTSPTLDEANDTTALSQTPLSGEGSINAAVSTIQFERPLPAFDTENANAESNERLMSYADARSLMSGTAIREMIRDEVATTRTADAYARERSAQADEAREAREMLRSQLQARTLPVEEYEERLTPSLESGSATPTDEDIIAAALHLAETGADTQPDLELQMLLGQAALETTNPNLLQIAHDVLPATREQIAVHPETAALRAKIEIAQGVVSSDDPSRVIEIADRRAYQAAKQRIERDSPVTETTRLIRQAFHKQAS